MPQFLATYGAQEWGGIGLIDNDRLIVDSGTPR